MIVIVPKTSGFCPGVKRAEDGVFKIKETSNKVNLHGPLIHNQNYISMLQQHNIRSVAIDSLSQGDTLVIRTHGISRHEEQTLADKFVLKDLTCPIVKRVQKNVEKAANDNSFVIISGKADHAEVQGLVSYAQFFLVIESNIELDLFIKDYHRVIPKECQRIFIISQTTHSREFFEELCATIQQNISHLPITVKDTICSITENKEQESIQLQKDVDFTIVIGDSTSSNSKKLYTILKKASKNTIFIQNLIHLQQQEMSWNSTNKVLVVSSTSTPLFIEKEIVDYLEKI